MLKIAIPHRIYSENKVKIKNIIKKYGMSWDSGKNGWVNAATGDGVYIDRAIMDMILSDSFSGDMPMTMFVESSNTDFIGEIGEKTRAIGGTVTEEAAPAGMRSAPPVTPAPVRPPAPVKPGKGDIFTRLQIRDAEGCNTAEFTEKAAEDLRDINRRWERRKAQILREYERIGMDENDIDRFLHREEIAFRKSNACWVTGEFPSAQAGNGEDR
ncbi:MAG: hypothetical protein A4E28_02670 [Methanocella sp. PtaU1.Bin125]|nr:MAG: hypothetical protein A4E28_02670 [Methanocella sp. PtaU1.Bin125]